MPFSKDVFSISANVVGAELNRFRDSQIATQLMRNFLLEFVILIAALAFIPAADVIEVFEQFIDSPFFKDHEEEIRELVNYFEDNWIGRPARRGGRSASIFPVTLWNVHDQVVHDLPRTNNSVEGWHRGFSQLLGAYHPTIWKFIDGLKKEQSMNEMKLEQFLAGRQPPPS